MVPIIDHHTCFLQVMSLRDKTSNMFFTAFMDNCITLFGAPDQMRTDNDSHDKDPHVVWKVDGSGRPLGEC